MSSVFYKESTAMTGVDLHPLDNELLEPHVVGSFYVASAYAGSRTTDVLADGEFIIQEGCSMVLVPHVAIPETPIGAVRLLITTLSSGSKAVLAVHSVVANGAPLACALHDSIGLNLNCNKPIKFFSGATISIGTVVTQPTGRDFASAGQTVVFDIGWSWVSRKFWGRFDPHMAKWSQESKEIANLFKGIWSTWGKSLFKSAIRSIDSESVTPYVNRVLK